MAALGRFFFYGTLMDEAVRRLILGRSLDEALVPGWLTGFRRVTLDGGAYPGIVPAPGETVPGLVASGITPRESSRLRRFEGEGFRLSRLFVHLCPAPGEGDPGGALPEKNVPPQGIECQVFVPRHLPGHLRGPVGAFARRVQAWDLGQWQRRHKRRFLQESAVWLRGQPE